MAVSAKWFGAGLAGQWSATSARRVDWVTDTIKTLLTTSSYTPDQDTHDFKNDVTNEISGTNYVAGGVALSNKSVTYDSASNETRLDADDASWSDASFTARYAVTYSDTAGAASTDPVLGYVDFGGDEVVSSGTFEIRWDSTGVLKVTAA